MPGLNPASIVTVVDVTFVIAAAERSGKKLVPIVDLSVASRLVTGCAVAESKEIVNF